MKVPRAGEEAPPYNDLIAKDPSGALAMLVEKAWPGLIHLKGKYSWWSELHHRLLIFVAVNCQHFKMGGPLPREDPLFWHTRSVIANLLEHEVSKTHMNEAVELSKDLDRGFIRDAPLYFGSLGSLM